MPKIPKENFATLWQNCKSPQFCPDWLWKALWSYMENSERSYGIVRCRPGIGRTLFLACYKQSRAHLRNNDSWQKILSWLLAHNLEQGSAVFRCLSPFEIGTHTFLEKLVLADFSWYQIGSIVPFQDWNQHFFGKISFSWFFMKSNRFNSFRTKSLRNIFWG